MSMIRNEKGFTLIELMVVILIIGILVAIAVPVFSAARAAAYKSTCQANLRTIDGAMEAYNATVQAYPTDPATELVGQYLKAWPTCPSDGAYDVDNAGADGSSAPTVTCQGAPANGHTYP